MERNEKLENYIIDFERLNQLTVITKVHTDGSNPFDDGFRGYKISHSVLNRKVKIWEDISKSKKIEDLSTKEKETFNNLYYNKIILHKSDFDTKERDKRINDVLN